MWAVISVASVSAIQSTQATRLPANLDRRRARLVTERRPVLIAVRNVSGRRRWSKLQEWLSADAHAPTKMLFDKPRHHIPGTVEVAMRRDLRIRRLIEPEHTLRGDVVPYMFQRAAESILRSEP